MWVDDQVLEPEILPADEARAIYEGVRRNRDPAPPRVRGTCETIRASIFNPALASVAYGSDMLQSRCFCPRTM